MAIKKIKIQLTYQKAQILNVQLHAFLHMHTPGVYVPLPRWRNKTCSRLGVTSVPPSQIAPTQSLHFCLHSLFRSVLSAFACHVSGILTYFPQHDVHEHCPYCKWLTNLNLLVYTLDSHGSNRSLFRWVNQDSFISRACFSLPLMWNLLGPGTGLCRIHHPVSLPLC